jgi:cobaltochelatase CobN
MRRIKMGRIVFLTNLERQKVMMERARENLLQENRLKPEGRTVLLHDAVPWGEEWEKTFAASDIVFFTYMGSGLDTDFLKKAAEFLRKHKITHVMLITDPGVDDLRCGITPEDQETLQKYLSYGGLENYHNLWLWLSSRFCWETCDYQLPQPLLWNGIYHPSLTHIVDNLLH